jgi:hypothetical protein
MGSFALKKKVADEGTGNSGAVSRRRLFNVMRCHKLLPMMPAGILLVFILVFSFPVFGDDERVISESWMGVYMEGIKVGYSHNREIVFSSQGEEFTKFVSESRMRVSRLGGAAVEIASAQESLYRGDETPLETVVRTRMSESEIVLKAEILEDKILFRSGEKLVKEYPYSERVYLGIPVKKILEEGDLEPGKTFSFPVLDPIAYAVRDSTFTVLEKEDVLILAKKMNLWHVRTEMASIIPVVIEEWIDEEGTVWKSVSQASFLNTTSIRMPMDKALEMSGENFDIAFSSIIRSNVRFPNPQQVRAVTFKLTGLTPEIIRNFPFDDGSQVLEEAGEDFSIIRTSSRIFREEESVSLPVEEGGFQAYLKPTTFVQSDDPAIQETAREIVGEEKNAWRAAKKIALWVRDEMTANYDVGFATATEILENREGDCSEHTVIMVALCRAVGIPARAAVGVMYGDGIFAYHMWPEVYAGQWINLDAKWLAVDEETGEFYTDATHIKFGRSNLDDNIFEEMVKAVSEIIGKLDIRVLDFEDDR